MIKRLGVGLEETDEAFEGRRRILHLRDGDRDTDRRRDDVSRPADEALRMGLCNRVVPTGQALEAALALAHQLAAFPQPTLRADRASALAAEGLPLQQALLQEWAGGRECLAEALRGASRFAAGQGRHGEF